MYPPAWLSDHLGELTDALDDPGTDLSAILSVLFDDLTAAIPSFLGLVMIVHADGRPTSLTAIAPAAAGAARASMRLPLDAVAGAAPDSSVTFYAETPGAFVDLATDTRRAYRLDGAVQVDRHLIDAGSSLPPVDGLRHAGAINRALGVLIAQGFPPDGARLELRRRADELGADEPEAAARTLELVSDGGDAPAGA